MWLLRGFSKYFVPNLKRPFWFRLLFAVLIVTLAILFTRWTPAIRQGTPYMFFFLAVTICALYGGISTGLIAIGLSLLGVTFWVYLPDNIVYLSSAHLFQLSAFLTIATLIAALVYTMQKANQLAYTQQESLQATLASIGDGVIAVDAYQHVTWLNAVAAELTGWTVAAASRRPLTQLLQLVHEADQTPVADPLAAALQPARYAPLSDYLLIAKDSTQHAVNLTAAPLRDERGHVTGTVLVVRDISERKHYEAELKEFNAQLEQQVQERTAELVLLNREMDEFNYVASHDLRAPLRAIHHLADWIKLDAGDRLPLASQGHLQKMQARVARMDQLLQDLLAYSRATRQRYRVETTASKAVVEDMVELLAPPAGFTVEIQPDLPVLLAERVPLETVFRNLIHNAIKHHLQPGDPQPSNHQPSNRHIWVTATEEGGWIEFVVADDGPGIAPEHHERIFQLFQTLKPRDQVEGSGMGLTLVKKLVEMRGGSIWVESSAGAGANFHFTWRKEPISSSLVA